MCFPADALFALIERLALVLNPSFEHDCLEFGVSSAGRFFASVYRREPLTTQHCQTLLDQAALTDDAKSAFWLLLSRMPAERHMFRVGLDGKVSIFFKTDVPVTGIAAIAEAFAASQHAGPIEAYFQQRKRPAVGFALEASPYSEFRLRFYDHCDSREELLAQVESLSGWITPPERSEVEALTTSFLDPPATAVINLGSQHGSLSAKFEFPQVPLSQARAVLQPLGGNEVRAFETAQQLGSQLASQESKLTYLGVRYAAQLPRELTLYLDARSTIHRAPVSRHPSRGNREYET